MGTFPATEIEMTDVSALILELAAEVRNGGDLEALLPEFAADYGVRADVIRNRFDRAYPEGVGKPLPTEEEMLARRADDERRAFERNTRMMADILDFLRANPRFFN